MRVALCALFVTAITGCTATLPDGVFRCTDDSSCPGGMHCDTALHLCRRMVIDAGADDAATNDAFVAPDTGPVDAGPCMGADCVTLTVTNAYGDEIVAGTAFAIEGRSMTVPAFGATTDSFSISLGGNGHLDIHTPIGDISLMANAHMTYALVLGRDPTMPTSIMPVGRLLPATFTTPGAGQFNIYPIDMMQDGTSVAITDGVTVNAMDPMTDGGIFHVIAGTRTAIALHQFAADGTTPDVMIADFDASELPQTNAYYVVLTGRIDAHLAGPQGVRMIAVVPGIHLLQSWPVVFVLNTTETRITLCDGATVIGGVDSQHLLQGVASFTTMTPAGEAVTIGLTNGTCPADTGAGHMPTTPVPMPPTTVGGRALLVVEGLVSSGMWGGATAFESPPGGPMAAQVITYGNGSPGHTANFGSSAMPMRTGPVVAQGGIGYVEWMARPSDLRIDYNGHTYTYMPWAPMSTTAAVLFITDDMTNFIAYEMDTPFGQPWVLSVHPPGT